MSVYFLLLFQMCKPISNGYKAVVEGNKIPPALEKTLEHHGLQKWKSLKAFEFTVNKEGGAESYTLDLNSRNTLIESKDFTIYKNEEGCYVTADLEAFKSNPYFYHSVYYYFVAMPFMFADPGINYETLGDFAIEDTTYHGIKVSYDDGVGDASKDEYIILTDKETNEMCYLLYTVTFFSKENSNKWGAKRYGQWERKNGILLPTELISYKYEDHKLLEQKSVVKISNIDCSMNDLPPETFNPKGSYEKWVSKTEG